MMRYACLLAALLVSAAFAGAARAADDRRPNVVLIMADDMGWESVGCYGSEDYLTPRIDALAAAGVKFNHCYAQPICTPSRVKLMTGQYNFRNYDHFGYLNPADKTFGHLMQAAGYRTAIAGKWQLNGLYHGAPGGDDPRRPLDAGFDESCLWQVTQRKRKPAGSERFWSPLLERNGALVPDAETRGRYGPDVMSDFVCDFIERHAGEPFFVYYPTVLVHNPFVPTPDTIGDRPRDHGANRQPKEPDAVKANYAAMVAYFDKVVGKIVDRLEAVGELDNTLILVTSDNGTHKGITSGWNGTRVRGGKGTTIDAGTHVPLVAFWKGEMSAGRTLDDLVDFTDFYPTLAELAGQSVGADDPIDGRSFMPQLKGDPGQPRDWVLCHYQPYWGNYPGQQYVRDRGFKLYRAGGFYQPPHDLLEENDLAPGAAGADGESARAALGAVLNRLPPVPVQGGNKATGRPLYPGWDAVSEPND